MKSFKTEIFNQTVSKLNKSKTNKHGEEKVSNPVVGEHFLFRRKSLTMYPKGNFKLSILLPLHSQYQNFL